MKRIKLYIPHPAQRMFHHSKARFRIATCGRRFGKTYACVNEMVKFAWENPFSMCWWVAPTYHQARIAYRIITDKFHQAITQATKNPMEAVLHSGSMIQFKSTELPDNLRGEGVDFLVCDESSMIQEEAWTQALRPTLSDKNGRAILVGTPRGRNWFYHMYLRGQDEDYPDYASFQFPTSANPYIPEEEIQEVRETLPRDVFLQEYQAKFLESESTVFRGIMECIGGDREEPKADGEYLIAWDVAKQSDYSCFIVLDKERGSVVSLDRFNRIDYTIQIERLYTLAKKYHYAEIIMDSTGVGDPILEQVKQKGLKVTGYHFTHRSKQQLIEHLAVALEQREITFPNISVLINELMSYQYELTRAGNVTYNAPSGRHDDTVIALALVVWGWKHRRNPQIVAL